MTARARPSAGLAILIVAATAGRAHAFDWFTLLDWACDPKNKNGTAATIKADALALCDLTENTATTPSTCGTVAGTPAACNTTSVATNSYACQEGSVRISIAAGTGSTLGWTVDGDLTAVAAYYVQFDGGTCELAPIDPPPDGGAGTFVKTRGVINVRASFTAEGTGRVKFLGGTIFSVSSTATCGNSLKVFAHTTDTTVACEKPRCRRPLASGAAEREVDCIPDDTPIEPTPEPTIDPVPVPSEATPVHDTASPS